MKTLVRKFFKGKEKAKTDFSEFAYFANAGKKKKVVEKAVKRANEQQEAVIQEYNKICAQNSR